MILKDIKDIKDIVACVADAFDNIDDLGCDSEGLFEYIKDCNEDFTDRSRLGDRYCYSYAFLLEADKRNVELPIYQKKRWRRMSTN